jgi:thiol-disulfide isomerase/thioredoxin
MRRVLLTACTLLMLATGCAGENSPGLLPGPPDVDVDTPELRHLKAEAGVADCVPGTAEPVDPPAGGLPDVTLPCLGGGPDVNPSTLRGPLVVNLWASFCGPCRTELPIYQRFSEKYAGRVAVVGIDYNDTQAQQALSLIKKTGVTYPLLADPATDLAGKGAFQRILGLPVLALVDEDGEVVFQEPLEIKSLEQLEDLVEQHLGVGA